MERKRLASAVLAIIPAIVSARPSHAAIAYATAGVDFPYVVGVAVTDTNYAMAGQHTAFATIRVTAPSGRYIEYTAFQADEVSISAYLPIESEDGEFTALNLNPREWCPWGMVYYQVQSSGPATTTVNPWVRLTSTFLNPLKISKKNGSATFDVRVMTSTYCAGPVTVLASMAPPTGMGIAWEGNENSRSLPLSGAGNATFSFVAHTDSANVVSGVVTLVGSIQLYPANCELKGPGGGQSDTQSLTVEAN